MEWNFDINSAGSYQEAVAILAIIGALLFIKAVQASPLSLVIPMHPFTPVFAVLSVSSS